MALPMVPAADFKQSLHLKAAGWQESQGILKFLQPCDNPVMTIFSQVSEDQKHPRLKYMPVYLFAVADFSFISVIAVPGTCAIATS